MFVINNDKSIFITRGDIGIIEVSAMKADDENYIFQPDDIVRFRVVEKSHHDNIILQKDAESIESASETVSIFLTKEDTKIGDILNKPKDFWYEVELNPDTNPQTIIGYDSVGPKIFRLFPEGVDV